MVEQLIRNPFPLENIDVPTLVCASWSNHGLHSRGSAEAFLRVSSPDTWMCTHGRLQWETMYSPDAFEWQKAFFDHFLKGEDNGFERRPRVRLETRRTREDYVVRDETAWPPQNADFTPMYLNLKDGCLSTEAPPEPASRVYDAASRIRSPST